MSDGNEFVTRDMLLRPHPRRFTVVDVPGWGRVRIRSLTELERSRFEASIRDKNGQVSNTKLVDLKCRLIVLCVVDGDGNQILTNADIDVLRNQDARVTNALVDAIQGHCGITSDDIEDMEKNLGATAAGDSRSS